MNALLIGTAGAGSGGGGSTPTLDAVLNPVADKTFNLTSFSLTFSGASGTSAINLSEAGSGGINLTNTGTGGVSITDTGAAGLTLNGAAGGIVLISTGGIALSADGTSNGNPITVDAIGTNSGVANSLQLNPTGNPVLLNSNGATASGVAPSTDTSTGIIGTILWATVAGTSYIYVCVAANTWRRVALSTF